MAGVFTVLLCGCSDQGPVPSGTVLFDVAAIPSNITRVVGRVAGDSVVLTAVGVDTGYAARGSLGVNVGTHIVSVDAYKNTTRLYTGKDTITVTAGDTVAAVVPLVCIDPGCLGATGIIFTFFPVPESEDNNSTAACDTMSWARPLDVPHGPGVPAPYAYAGNGTMSSGSDVDYWCAFIPFTSGDSLVAFTVTGPGSGLDPVLTLLGPTGTVLASNDNAGGENPSDARINYHISSSGRYYLRVSAASAPTSPGRYSVFMYVGIPGAMP